MKLRKRILSVALASALTISSIGLSSFLVNASSSNSNTKNIMAALGTLKDKHQFSSIKSPGVDAAGYENRIHSEDEFAYSYASDYTFYMRPSSAGTSVTHTGISNISKDPVKSNYYGGDDPYPNGMTQAQWDKSNKKYLPVITDNDDLVGGKKSTAVYKLPASKSGTYNLSCTYKKAGTYNGKDIDVKITISNWDVANDWQSAAGNDYTNRMPGGGDFGFIAFSSKQIGVYVAYINWVSIDYSFTYSDTGAAANVKGWSAWTDVDYSQGITFKKNTVSNNNINVFQIRESSKYLRYCKTTIGEDNGLSIYDAKGDRANTKDIDHSVQIAFQGTGFNAIYSFCGHQESTDSNPKAVRPMPSGTIQNKSSTLIISNRVQVIKTDTNRNFLSGATFDLYQKKPGGSFVKVSTATTGADGTAYFKNNKGSTMWPASVQGIDYVYKVIETKAPDGYIKDSSEKQGLAGSPFVFTNEGFKGTVKLRKVDSETGKNLEGAIFNIYEYDKNNSKNPYDDNRPVASGKTDVNGELTLNIQYSQNNQGKFKIKEIKSPGGYEGKWEQEITLKENGEVISDYYTNPTPNDSSPYDIEVKKLDKDNEYKLSGAVFEVQEWSEEEQKYNKFCILDYDEATQTYINSERLYCHQKINNGKYKVVEVKAPDGYKLENWEKEFILTDYDSSKPIEFTCENPVYKGVININKTNTEMNKVLEGVEYDIIATRNIYLPQGQKVVSKGDIVDHLITDENGQARSKELYIDWADQTTPMYNIVETKTLTDYILDTTPYPVSFNYDETFKEVTLNLKNEPMKPDSKIAKIADKTTGAELKDGRYTGTKISGVYTDKDTVNYTITVTNSGNVPILNTTVQDKMSDELAAVIENAKFITNGEVQTVDGNKANVTLNSDTEVVIDKLAVGDSIQLIFQAKIKKDTIMKYQLDNVAIITSSSYDNNEDEKPYEPTNPDNWKDNDKINIPGSPELRVAKLANKTTGAKLENGRYKGKKQSGMYEAGEKVTYTITVSNTRNADAFEVVVKDTMSKELKAVLDKDSITFTKLSGSIKSKNGVRIKITSKSNTKLVLDKLPAGDSVELTLTATVKSELSQSASDLNNKVEITGKYNDGNGNVDVPVTKLMIDDDDINVNVPEPVIPPSDIPDTGDKALGTIVVSVIGLLASIGFVVYSKFKRRKEIKG